MGRAASTASTSAVAASSRRARPATTTTRASPKAAAGSSAPTRRHQRVQQAARRVAGHRRAARHGTRRHWTARAPTVGAARDRRQRPGRACLNRAAQASKTVMDGGRCRGTAAPRVQCRHRERPVRRDLTRGAPWRAVSTLTAGHRATCPGPKWSNQHVATAVRGAAARYVIDAMAEGQHRPSRKSWQSLRRPLRWSGKWLP